jgi:hypothetical protein
MRTLLNRIVKCLFCSTCASLLGLLGVSAGLAVPAAAVMTCLIGFALASEVF